MVSFPKLTVIKLNLVKDLKNRQCQLTPMLILELRPQQLISAEQMKTSVGLSDDEQKLIKLNGAKKCKVINSIRLKCQFYYLAH